MENKLKFQKALNHNVVVEQIVLENKTTGGFDMSGYVDANESQQAGVIVAIGEGCPRDKDGNHYIKLGDTIVFSKFKVTSMTIGGVNYRIVPYLDLTLVV